MDFMSIAKYVLFAIALLLVIGIAAKAYMSLNFDYSEHYIGLFATKYDLRFDAFVITTTVEGSEFPMVTMVKQGINSTKAYVEGVIITKFGSPTTVADFPAYTGFLDYLLNTHKGIIENPDLYGISFKTERVSGIDFALFKLTPEAFSRFITSSVNGSYNLQ